MGFSPDQCEIPVVEIESLRSEENVSFNPCRILTLLYLAVATSIDALAVGVTFALLTIKIIPAVLTIGAITCALSAAGVKLGSIFGARWRNRAELAGGIILILLGTKILLEHLGIL